MQLALQVRFVFESQAGTVGPRGEQKSKNEQNRDSMNIMKKVLEKIMAREKNVITDWCSRNSGQMQTALDTVAHLQEQAERMEKDLHDTHAQLAVRMASDCLGHAAQTCNSVLHPTRYCLFPYMRPPPARHTRLATNHQAQHWSSQAGGVLHETACGACRSPAST
jgi:hypothetical protein